MKKTMFLSIITVTFLAGTVLSSTFDMAVATSHYCNSVIPKGSPFNDIWAAICDLHNQQEIQINSLQTQINNLQPGPNPINCPVPFANLAGNAAKLTPLVLENLQGCDLTGINLSFADLRYANMQDVILSGTYLKGANLNGAILDGADWTGAHGQCFGHPQCDLIPPL
jgi:uncharacterized protein YjbI with pentapeptide repeats